LCFSINQQRRFDDIQIAGAQQMQLKRGHTAPIKTRSAVYEQTNSKLSADQIRPLLPALPLNSCA
jgi:hypothetical protein